MQPELLLGGKSWMTLLRLYVNWSGSPLKKRLLLKKTLLTFKCLNVLGPHYLCEKFINFNFLFRWRQTCTLPQNSRYGNVNKFVCMTFCMYCQKNLKIKGHNILVFMCIGVRAIFCQGGGKPFAQKILASCPNFYETVENWNEGHTMQQHRPYWHMKVARYCNSFSGSISPNFEHKYVAIDKLLENLPPQFY